MLLTEKIAGAEDDGAWAWHEPACVRHAQTMLVRGRVQLESARCLRRKTNRGPGVVCHVRVSMSR
jgi:hypothetical protein